MNWKRTLFDLVQTIKDYFHANIKGLKVSIDDIFNKYLKDLTLEVDPRIGKPGGPRYGGRYLNTTTTIELPEYNNGTPNYNRSLLCHELLHFVKSKSLIDINENAIDEMVTDLLTEKITGVNDYSGYYRLKRFAKYVEQNIEPLDFADFFNNNLDAYIKRNSIINLVKLYEKGEDIVCGKEAAEIEQEVFKRVLFYHSDNLLKESNDLKYVFENLANIESGKYFCDNKNINRVAYTRVLTILSNKKGVRLPSDKISQNKICTLIDAFRKYNIFYKQFPNLQNIYCLNRNGVTVGFYVQNNNELYFYTSVADKSKKQPVSQTVKNDFYKALIGKHSTDIDIEQVDTRFKQIEEIQSIINEKGQATRQTKETNEKVSYELLEDADFESLSKQLQIAKNVSSSTITLRTKTNSLDLDCIDALSLINTFYLLEINYGQEAELVVSTSTGDEFAFGKIESKGEGAVAKIDLGALIGFVDSWSINSKAINKYALLNDNSDSEEYNNNA